LAQSPAGFCNIADKLLHFLQGLGSAQQIDLVEHNHDLLAPGAHPFKEGALAFGEGPINRGNEEYEVAARDKFFGDLLVFAQHGIDARRIHNCDIPQKVCRVANIEQTLRALLVFFLWAMAQHGDHVCSGDHTFFQDWSA
jgi:hypothetical protein